MPDAAAPTRVIHPQYRIKRMIASLTVTAGGFQAQDLPRDYDYEALGVRINGGLQVTVAATSVRAEAPFQVVPRITVVADGKNNLFNAPLWFAGLGNYERALTESGARVTTPPSGTGIATYQVEAIGIIDFMTQGGQRPKDSNFRPSGLQIFQALLTYGQPGDPFVGGTVNYSSMFVDLFALQLVEQPAPDGSFTKPLFVKKISYQEVAMPASNTQFDTRLPAGNVIKTVLVRTEGSVTAGEPATNILNRAILQSGVDVRVNLTSGNVRALNNADYGQLTAGYYILDLTSKGMARIALSELWDVTQQNEPKLTVDETGGATVKMQVVTTEYVPIP